MARGDALGDETQKGKKLVEEAVVFTITLDAWTAAGLTPAELVPFNLTPAATRRAISTVRSPVLGEGWLVVYPDPADRHRDVIAGTGLRPQAARDVAAWLRGEAPRLYPAGDPQPAPVSRVVP